MALSIGVDYRYDCWRICVLENTVPVEYKAFASGSKLASHIHRLCACYPEPHIALSSHLELPLRSWHTLSPHNLMHIPLSTPDEQMWLREREELATFFAVVSEVSLHSYCLPSLRYLDSVPPFRKLYRRYLGGSDRLCAVATLLYRMRLREAIWPEMRFLYLDISTTARHITAIQDGYIVDDMGEKSLNYLGDAHMNSEELTQALEEDIRQDLAAMLVLHHVEDLIVMDRGYEGIDASSRALSAPVLSETILARLGDVYQVYRFPREASEPEGFECALGAALLIEGLYRPGLVSEIAERLMAPAQM